jgi:hypothetical protein
MDTTAYDACMSAVPFDAVAPSDFLIRLQPGDENVITPVIGQGKNGFIGIWASKKNFGHSPWSRQW